LVARISNAPGTFRPSIERNEFNTMSRLNQFLSGVRVLDLSHYLPGPMAALLLADMGADVLKIVAPAGDAMTVLGPRAPDGSPLFYNTVNAGKRVATLDLKEAGDRSTFLKLIAEADVLIEGFRPGVLERLGFGVQTLHSRNPRLIVCALSGYGASGPQINTAGHDGSFLAAAGILHRNSDGLFDPPIADTAGALFAVIAILGALHGRNRDALGCSIDLGLADALMPLQLFAVAAHGALGIVPRPNDTYLNGGAAYYRDYRTADGARIVLAAVEAKFWGAFCAAAGRPQWLERHSDPIPQQRLIREVADYFASLSAQQFEERFLASDCCCSLVLDLGQALASPQVLARDLVRRTEEGSLQALFPAIVDGQTPASRTSLKAGVAEFLPLGPGL
jgi:crotonobetainyl-CoA:carnitine CoA-transferase CaiB-like acyl-CoA transferase